MQKFALISKLNYSETSNCIEVGFKPLKFSGYFVMCFTVLSASVLVLLLGVHLCRGTEIQNVNMKFEVISFANLSQASQHLVTNT